MKTNYDFPKRGSDNPSPFTLGKNQRPLRMFVDRKTLRLSLASQMLDEMFRANDPDLEIFTTWFPDRDMVSWEKENNDIQTVWFQTWGGKAGSGVMNVSTWSHFASDPSILFPEGEMRAGPWSDEAYRLERYKLLKAAENRDIDFYVTDSDFLLKYTPKRVWGTNVVTSDEAISVVGTHLRNRGNFLLEASTDGWLKRSLDRISFYMILRLSILGPLNLSLTPGDAEMVESIKAPGALNYRCEQMLKSRDHALVNLLQPRNNSTSDEALYFFDMFLLTMGGMLDALAKIADHELSLKSKNFDIGWNKKKWQQRIKGVDKTLYDLASRESRGRSLLDLHAVLRNSIHGERIDALHYRGDSKPEQSLIVLSGEDATKAAESITRLGGLEVWGAAESLSNDVWLDVGVVMERLFEDCTIFMIQIAHQLEMTGEERNYNPSPDDWLFAQETRERIAMLAGCYHLRQKRLRLSPAMD